MRLLDEKFLKNKWNYIFQSLLAAVSIFVILLELDAISDAAIVASLGASSFIVFTMPSVESSKTRCLIGGYIVGIIAGCLCYYLSLLPIFAEIPFISEPHNTLFPALAVGVAIFIMVITDTEHPPAAGIALGLVLDECQSKTIIVVLIGIISLSVLKTLLRPVIKDLL